MNKFRLISFVAITLGTILSCTEVDSNLGNDLVPESSKMQLDIAEFKDNFKTYNLSVDSIPTSTWGFTMVGSVVSPSWGQTNYSFISTLLPYSGFSPDSIWGDNPTIDSVRFLINPYAFNGVANIEQQINVYPLKKVLPNFVDSIFYSNFDIEDYVDKTKIMTSMKLNDGGAFKAEVPIEFIEPLLDTTGYYFADGERFINKFPGIYVTSPTAYSEGISRSIDLSNSGIEIYYHNKNTPVADTAVMFLSMANTIGTYNVAFTMIEHDFSLADPVVGIDDKIIATSENYETIGVQDVGYVFSQGGLMTKLDLNKENFENLIASAKSSGYSTIAVSSAILKVPVLNDTPSELDTALNRLGTYLEFERQIYTPDYETEVEAQIEAQEYGYTETSTHYNGYMNRESKSYIINLTSYVQDLLSEEEDDFVIELSSEMTALSDYKGAFLDTKNIELEITYMLIK